MCEILYLCVDEKTRAAGGDLTAYEKQIEKIFEGMKERNRHGFGVFIPETGQIFKDDEIKAWLALKPKEMIAHARLASHGSVCAQNTQPLESARWVVAHNGIFSGSVVDSCKSTHATRPTAPLVDRELKQAARRLKKMEKRANRKRGRPRLRPAFDIRLRLVHGTVKGKAALIAVEKENLIPMPQEQPLAAPFIIPAPADKEEDMTYLTKYGMTKSDLTDAGYENVEEFNAECRLVEQNNMAYHVDAPDLPPRLAPSPAPADPAPAPEPPPSDTLLFLRSLQTSGDLKAAMSEMEGYWSMFIYDKQEKRLYYTKSDSGRIKGMYLPEFGLFMTGTSDEKYVEEFRRWENKEGYWSDFEPTVYYFHPTALKIYEIKDGHYTEVDKYEKHRTPTPVYSQASWARDQHAAQQHWNQYTGAWENGPGLRYDGYD